MYNVTINNKPMKKFKYLCRSSGFLIPMAMSRTSLTECQIVSLISDIDKEKRKMYLFRLCARIYHGSIELREIKYNSCRRFKSDIILHSS